ncbi:MAG: HAD-IIB family hydrolase [Eubacterium sp.]|nr:HAD-IIB family hydrolase [Eubacterium sp.]
MTARHVAKQYAKMAVQRIYLPGIYRKYEKLPVEKGKVIFACSHSEGMDINMLPVAEKLERYGYNIVDMCVSFEKMKASEKKKYIADFMKEYATAEYVFLSNYFLPAASCRKRKETKVIQLWHSGGLLKKMGYDSPDDISPYYKGNPMANVDILCVSAEKVAPYFEHALRLNKGVVRPLGMARTDKYYDEDYNKKLKERFYELYPEAEGKLVCVYAPSFSGNASDPVCKGIESGVTKVFDRLKDRYFFVTSLHPCLHKKYPEYDCPLITEELLPAADIMITDYSSVVYDMMLYEKPFIFFVPDMEHYKKRRGLCIEPAELGAPVTKSLKELYTILKEFRTIPEDRICENVQKYMNKCDGHSVERILTAAGIKPDIKLAAIDLDDTFLGSGGNMTEYAKEALMAADKAGIEVVVASGRSYSSLPKELVKLPCIRYAICSNGANVVDNRTGERIHSYFMTEGSVRDVLKLADKYDMFVETFVDGVPHSSKIYLDSLDGNDKLSAHRKEYLRNTRIREEDIKAYINENISHLDCVDFMVHDQGLKEAVLEELKSVDDIYVTSSVDYLIEISFRDCGKERGMEVIGEKLGIAPEQMAAFGNADNDIGMLKLAGTGYAVANASESCIEAADIVIGPNTKDSVANEIFEIIKQKTTCKI